MRSDTLRGHLDAMLLAVLESEPHHGYAIIEALKKRSGGELDVPTGTVYPALRRLERAGYLRSSWSNVGGRERRTYALTGAGTKELAAQRGQWRRTAHTIGSVLGTELGRASRRGHRAFSASARRAVRRQRHASHTM